MAKRNDFLEGFLKGLYSSGFGNPEVQRANQEKVDNTQAALNLKMAEQGMIPSPHPEDMKAKIGGFISQMFGGPSKSLNTAFTPDPNQNQYAMDDSGKISLLPPGTPIPAAAKRLPPDKGMTALASQWRDQNSSPSYQFAGTDSKGQPIILNSKTGQLSTAQTPSGGPILSKNNPTKINDEIKDIDIQMSQLVDIEKLLKGIPTSAEGGIQSVGSKLTGGLYAPKAKQYNDIRPSFAVKIYRAATGDTRLSDSDAMARAYPMVPSLSDSAEVRAGKMKQIRALLDNRKKILSSGGTGETPWPFAQEGNNNAAGGWNTEKEARYQELLRKRNGSK